ncbi:hypothetical protein Syun_003706 [Stephania yunnanensis]|uniref:Uncharacterized protein n=1 Tax=Stephania yunnanensis TaxID=152371 RepID=A0AAP0Q1V3_9MAGN
MFSILLSFCTDRLPSSALCPSADAFPSAFSTRFVDAPSRSPRSQPTMRSPPSALTSSLYTLTLMRSPLFAMSIQTSLPSESQFLFPLI